MSEPDIERPRSIKTFPSLVKYLRDELDWPIGSEDFDELTFDNWRRDTNARKLRYAHGWRS